MLDRAGTSGDCATPLIGRADERSIDNSLDQRFGSTAWVTGGVFCMLEAHLLLARGLRLPQHRIRECGALVPVVIGAIEAKNESDKDDSEFGHSYLLAFAGRYALSGRERRAPPISDVARKSRLAHHDDLRASLTFPFVVRVDAIC